VRLYPAIDVMGGRCVRLEQGDFERATEFSANPVKRALEWEQSGASYIHVVDLDGARFGVGRNIGIIEGIARAVSVPVQVGGGIRGMDDMERRLSGGVARVILGTVAVRNPELVRDAVRVFGDRVAVGIDSRDGKVAVEGWGEVSSIETDELCSRMRDAGVRTVIHTDIASDGMMTGPNLDTTRRLVALGGMDIIASGGVSNISDLYAVRDIGASGAIIGRALYNGAIDLSEAVRIFEESGDERC
jgi:phosphoribosylformimino-5-aminoimidazole carboxamide ribotide isomerase